MSGQSAAEQAGTGGEDGDRRELFWIGKSALVEGENDPGEDSQIVCVRISDFGRS